MLYTKHKILYFLLVCFFSFNINVSAQNENENSDKINIPKSYDNSSNSPRVISSKSLSDFSIVNQLDGKDVVIDKEWLVTNPDQVLMNEDSTTMVILKDSECIVTKEEDIINDVLIATKKRFPKPFRIKKKKRKFLIN